MVINRCLRPLRALLGLLLVFLLSLLTCLIPMSPAIASLLPNALPTTTTLVQGLPLVLPDWTRITWSSFPAVLQEGYISITDPTILSQLGYNPSRTWAAGTPVDQVVMLGDVQEVFGLEQFNLSQIAGLSHLALENLNLNDLGLSQWQTPATLTQAIPGLGQLPVSAVPPIQDLLLQVGRSELNSLPIEDLVAQFPDLAQLPLGNLDLSQYPLTAIPGLGETPLGQFGSWQQSLISQVPGLNQVPFAQFPVPLPTGITAVALADIMFGPLEAQRTNTISGSTRNDQFQAEPCAQSSCPHIELADLGGTGGPFQGKQWISGLAQQVPGGKGVLAALNEGKEPTGILVWGPAFKVAVIATDEATASAQFGLYLRVCIKNAWVDLGCTPYFIGPIPWLTVREEGMVLLSAAGPPPPITIPAEYQQQMDQIVGQYTPQPSAGDGAGVSNCTEYRGVQVGAFKDAIAHIESRGSGDYQAIGNYTCDDYGNCGRGLGRYQFMSYKEQVEPLILSKPGGAAYLAKLNQANPSAAYQQQLAQELPQYLTAAEQESLMSTQSKMLLDQAAGEGLSGDSLVGRAGEMHNAGEYSQPGASPHYASQTTANYHQILPQKQQQCAAGSSGGPISQQLAQASNAAHGMSTANGPDRGNQACVYAVNQVMQKAGVQPFSTEYVPTVVDQMQAGRGQQVAQSQAHAGDIVIAKGREHIGICLNEGCTQIRSNSSSRASFSWISNGNFNGEYDDSRYLHEAPQTTYWRLVK